MNVNQHAPMTSQYGQPHSGYGQPSYSPLDGGYPTPYAPYNGPASAYQPGAPQQGTGSSLMSWIVTLPASRCVIVHIHILKFCCDISSKFSFHFLPFSLLLASFLLLCISGYSPFSSFPSKAANPGSDLPSPLDLGNCLLFCCCFFHTDIKCDLDPLSHSDQKLPNMLPNRIRILGLDNRVVLMRQGSP